jgi:hypothetical protein
MLTILKQSLWLQLGASIDSLKEAIEMCPATLWDTEKKFWYQAYHTIFFLDYYLTTDPIHFCPPAPFTLSELGEAMPERVYTKEELLVYLSSCRNKCEQLLNSMTIEVAESKWINESKTMIYPVIEILMYNMRHVQHHAAQLNLILRQEIKNAPEWIFRAKNI